MSRRPVIAANWKMNMTVAEAEGFLDRFRPGPADADVVICPSFLALSRVAELGSGHDLGVAAQNMHFEDSGAFTGEVSAPMLLEQGVAWVVLGHSERRQMFGETDENLALKVPQALAAGLIPILCVGETGTERDRGETDEVLATQVLTDLAEVHDRDLDRVVIAYEPCWAIGTGVTATPEQAQHASDTIRNLLRRRDPEAAARIRIIYGGSVKPDNAAELLALPDVDGALVGGAALDPDDFAAIVAAVPGGDR